MRLILTTGMVICLSSSLGTPAYAGGVAGGIGEGFLSGVGWSLCDGVGKVIVKAVRGKNHKSESTNTDNNREMTPDEVYNQGLEDGYARAREEAGGSLYEGRYARAQDNSNQMRTDNAPKQYVQTRVYAKRLTDRRFTAAKPAVAHRASRSYSNVQQNKQKTPAASQTANSTVRRKPIAGSGSDKNQSKTIMATQMVLN